MAGKKLKNNLKLPYVHILLGARQTGKSTLINKLIPIEVKWTERPIAGDAKHIESFIREHEKVADKRICYLSL